MMMGTLAGGLPSEGPLSCARRAQLLQASCLVVGIERQTWCAVGRCMG